MTSQTTSVVFLPGAYSVSELLLITFEGLPETAPREWEAICEWCQFHDMDPKRMPIRNQIVRGVRRRLVEYDEIVYDANDRMVVERDEIVTRRAVSQGEGPPLPFPALLFESDGAA